MRTSGPAARTVCATAVATRSCTSSCGGGPNLFLVAPLDANTLAKFAVGLCDNCLTCVWRAWDPGRPLVIAPAMNTFMWETSDDAAAPAGPGRGRGCRHVPGHLDDVATVAQINARCKTFRIVGPQVKELACGDVGAGGMANVPDLVAAVDEMLAPQARPA